MTHDFLLEIGTEEIPAGYLRPAGDHLRTTLTAGLDERRIDVMSVTVHEAPRRLIARITGLVDRQPDLSKEVMGPPTKAAFAPDGTLTKAGEGFARGQGVEPSALRRVDTPKGEYVAATVHVTGRPTADILLEWLPDVIRGIPFPKTMKWRGESLRFARPIRWLVALLDAEVLPIQVETIRAGRTTRGHRLVTPGPIEIESPASMLAQLEAAGVIADFDTRRGRVITQIQSAATAASARIVADDDLVDEVTNLVELPMAVMGTFDAEYLELPREVVITAMKAHQRYFAVEGTDGTLKPNFITVANGRWDDTSQVVAGNERVLRARLADARFYWDTDRKIGLVNKVDELKSVVWLEGAGTLHDRVTRIGKLVTHLARALRNADSANAVDAKSAGTADRVAFLAKADLATDMIRDGKEFTSLQGVMGGYYARAGGESAEVAAGIAEHYLPRGPQDALPATIPGLLVSLADRFDAIAGCFAMGLIPSGSQDPYALRRAANGIMRILMEKEWHLDLDATVGSALAALPPTAFAKQATADVVRARINDFLRDRLDYYLREAGVPYDVVAATLAPATTMSKGPVDARARANALAAIRGEVDLEKLVVGYKRAANILKGLENNPPAEPSSIQAGEPVEKDLWNAWREASEALRGVVQQGDYAAAVRIYLSLREPIDNFFTGVMVNSENAQEKRRRLGLLGQVRELFDRLYDFSRIVVEG